MRKNIGIGSNFYGAVKSIFKIFKYKWLENKPNHLYYEGVQKMFKRVYVYSPGEIPDTDEFDSEELMNSTPLNGIWSDTDDITVEEYDNGRLIRSYAYPKITFPSESNSTEESNLLKVIITKVRHEWLELCYLLRKIVWGIKAALQRVTRKSHMSNIDTLEFCITISKWLLPKILQYKKLVYENLYEAARPETIDNLGRASITKYELDEIIYALEWVTDTSPHTYTKKQNDFYIKYYGKTTYHPHKICEFKFDLDERDDNDMIHKARKRAQKGFELLGYHFTNLGDET
jgi:hypothetical protein